MCVNLRLWYPRTRETRRDLDVHALRLGNGLNAERRGSPISLVAIPTGGAAATLLIVMFTYV